MGSSIEEHAARPGTGFKKGAAASPGTVNMRDQIDTSNVVKIMLRGDRDEFRSQFKESIALMVAFNEDPNDESPNIADMIENDTVGGSLLMRPGVKPALRFNGNISRADNLMLDEGVGVFVLVAMVGQVEQNEKQ